jgi:hypothetical protein
MRLSLERWSSPRMLGGLCRVLLCTGTLALLAALYLQLR